MIHEVLGTAVHLSTVGQLNPYLLVWMLYILITYILKFPISTCKDPKIENLSTTKSNFENIYT